LDSWMLDRSQGFAPGRAGTNLELTHLESVGYNLSELA
jgi:hypothetical protein